MIDDSVALPTLCDLFAQFPNITPENFAAEAHRQSLAAATAPGAAEDMAFLDSIAYVWDDPEWVGQDIG